MTERELVAAIRGVRVLVVGDAMLDRHLMGEAERLSPEAPVPVVRIAERRVTPGGAANVAANVTAGGGTCALVGVVAEDAPGAELRAAVAGARVRDLMLTVRDRPTTNKTRVVARNQQVVRIDEEREAEVSAEDRAQLAAAASDALAEAQVLVFQDYDKGVCSAPLIKLLIAAAKQRGIPIVVDPKFRHFFDYSGATVFKPNRRELMAAMGSGVDLRREEALAAVRRRVGAEELLITLGSDGMLLVAGEGRMTRDSCPGPGGVRHLGRGRHGYGMGGDGTRGRGVHPRSGTSGGGGGGRCGGETRGRRGNGRRGACRLGDIRLEFRPLGPGD